MRTTGDAPVTVRRLSESIDTSGDLAADVMSGLTGSPKAIPSKYFYDARGSALFDDITRLPEYYLTQVETEILESASDDIMEIARPEELVELGSGYSVKTKLLIEAMRRAGCGQKYLPIDISEDALFAAAKELCGTYMWLEIEGLVGDFYNDLPLVPRVGRRMVVFLGSTIGNFDRDQQRDFVRNIRSIMEPGDHLLLGVDLVKDSETMIAAYNDSLGVTAEFTRNILHVVNRELQADFPADDFIHVPMWNADESQMEAWLESPRDITVRVEGLSLNVDLVEGERIHTEISAKFTPQSIASLFDDSDMGLVHMFTDPESQYALVLATPTLSLGGR